MTKISLKYSKQMESKGLGDTIEKFTKATGIKKAVETVAKATGRPCRCSERRDTLNRKFPYKK
jgi:predicted transcriptional regulator